MNKLLHVIGLIASFAACAEEQKAGVPENDAETGTSSSGPSLGGSGGHAGQQTSGGTMPGASGQNTAGKSSQPGAAGTADGGAPSSDSGGASGNGGSAGSAGSASSAGSGGAANACQGGEACVNYVMPCEPAACTNGHVPYCFCGGGEEPLVECHEGGESC